MREHAHKKQQSNREPGSDTKPQVQRKHPDEWQQDLNPDQLAGQNIGPSSDTASSDGTASPLATAFHLRKRGYDVAGLDDEELKQIPLVPDGSRLQQGATYVNLAEEPPREFTATGDMTADTGDAYAPKDRVPYEIWNRLIGEPKPGQERS